MMSPTAPPCRSLTANPGSSQATRLILEARATRPERSTILRGILRGILQPAWTTLTEQRWTDFPEAPQRYSRYQCRLRGSRQPSRNYIGKIERAERTPTLSVVEAIARAL